MPLSPLFGRWIGEISGLSSHPVYDYFVAGRNITVSPLTQRGTNCHDQCMPHTPRLCISTQPHRMAVSRSRHRHIIGKWLRYRARSMGLICRWAIRLLGLEIRRNWLRLWDFLVTLGLNPVKISPEPLIFSFYEKHTVDYTVHMKPMAPGNPFEHLLAGSQFQQGHYA